MNPHVEKTVSIAVMKMARNAGFDAILVADEQVEQFHSARTIERSTKDVPDLVEKRSKLT
jgi:hypothetical protein